ncbi:MAG: mevalonate kinase [Aerococcaceae bacterium]|nr:mevalonate kinase [Aerococcaceae bacterium]
MINTLTPTQIGQGTAHGKIILMGEHAVVYDFPAIAMPFDAVQSHVHITPYEQSETYLSCPYYNGLLNEAPVAFNNLKQAYQLTLESLKIQPQSMHIRIDSSIPLERGMGSSAAVSVALVRAIAHFYQKTLSDAQLRFIVNQAEVIAHATTSGIDTLMTSSAQPVIYRKSQPPKTFNLALDAFLVVADSGQTGQTKLAVQKVAQLKEARPLFANQVLSDIGSFVQKAYHAIQQQNVVELGRLMTYNHYYLNQLGVSTPELDQIVSAAWRSGALGAKLTGGGLGGCAIALASTEEEARYIANAMQEAGAIQTWITSLNAERSNLCHH